jgi:hypothetical protein
MICMSNITEIELHARVICIKSEEVLEIITKNCLEYLMRKDFDKNGKRVILFIYIDFFFILAFISLLVQLNPCYNVTFKVQYFLILQAVLIALS